MVEKKVSWEVGPPDVDASMSSRIFGMICKCIAGGLTRLAYTVVMSNSGLQTLHPPRNLCSLEVEVFRLVVVNDSMVLKAK